jgi:hypothetical protein
MESDYINFCVSPWYSIRETYKYDLDAGEFRILRKPGKIIILIRAKDYQPTKGKDNGRRPRMSDAKLFGRDILPKQEAEVVAYLQRKKYKPERNRII